MPQDIFAIIKSIGLFQNTLASFQHQITTLNHMNQ
jgi:hypothetical protein